MTSIAVPTASSVVRARWRSLAPATLLLCVHQLGEAAVPVVVGALIDEAIARHDPAQLAFWLAVLATDFALLSLSWRFGARFAATARLGIEHDLRMLVVGRVLHPGAMASPRRAGELVTIAASDARRVAGAVRTLISSAAGLVVLVATVALIARTSWLLAVLIVVAASLVLVVVSLLGGLVERRSHAEQEAGADAAAAASDLIAGLRVLAGLRAGATAAARYRRASSESLRQAVRAADADGLVAGITALATGLYLVAVAAVGAALAMAGAATIGDVIAVFGLSQFILGPLTALAAAWPAVARGRASAARIHRVLEIPMVLDDEATVDHIDAEARDTMPGGAAVGVRGLVAAGIRGLDLDVALGTLHGVVFASPDDADALVGVLGGERAATSGDVFVHGQRIDRLPHGVRRRELLVWPHGALPPGRELGELLLGRPGDEGEAERAGIRSAFGASAALDVIERRTDGLRSVVAEHGASLSGGEAQRVSLARLLIERPPILVLHEPASALDAVTEAAIAAGLRAHRAGLTTVVVTTSTALLSACDAVTFVDAATSVATGNHEALSLRDIAYRETVAR